MYYRFEKDSLGYKKVPSEAYYGIHTERAKENFQISGKTLPLELYYVIVEIKIAAAQANRDLNLLDKTKAHVIIKAAREILQGKFDKEFIVDIFQAGTGTPTHMNVNEVIANIAIELLQGHRGDYTKIHPNDDVNKGQSTNDVFPTALRICAIRKLNKLYESVKELEKELQKKSKEFRNIVKSGRTHLQDAVPITLGQEFHAYATAMEKQRKRIQESITYLYQINLGRNAIGTGINTHPQFQKKVIFHLQKITSLNVKAARDPIEATQSATDFLEVSQTVKLIAVDLIRISNDLRLLNSGPNTGLHEITLPAVEPGSSIMPGKVNPSIAEMMDMICFQIMGNTEAISYGVQAGQLELNVMLPLIAHNLLGSIEILTNGIRTLIQKSIKGIKVNREVCQYYLEHSAGLGTLLNPYIGYDSAARVVQESLRTGKSISEIVLEKKLLDEKELRKLLNHRRLTSPNLR